MMAKVFLTVFSAVYIAWIILAASTICARITCPKSFLNDKVRAF